MIEEYNLKDREEKPEFNKAIYDYFKAIHSVDTSIDLKDVKLVFNSVLQKNVGVPSLVSVEDYINILNSDPSLKMMINKLINWYFLQDEFKKGGLIFYSEPGVGKSVVMSSLNYITYCYQHNTRGKVALRRMDHDIQKHVSNKDSGVDLFYNIPEHLLLDDLGEKLNEVSTYKYDHSINDFFKIRYDQWQLGGKHTIITTNMIPNFDGEMDTILAETGTKSIRDFLDHKTLTRVRQQFDCIHLNGESKR